MADANVEDDDDEDDGDWDPENEDDGDEEDEDLEGLMDSEVESDAEGVTADLKSAVIGKGGYKTVYLAEETSTAHIVGFKYSELRGLGGSDLFTDYVIVTFSPKYDAQRLLGELKLQDEFAIDGLAPIVFGLEIYMNGKKYTTVYGIEDIIAELEQLVVNLEKANQEVRDTYSKYIQPIYRSIPSIGELEERIRLLDLRISHLLNSPNKRSLESLRLKLVTTFPSIPPKDEMETIEKEIKMIEKDIERSKELRSGFKEFLEAVKVRDDIEHASFYVLMQRTGYFTVDDRPLSGPSTIPVSSILDYDSLNGLLDAILDKKLVHLDLKYENLCVLKKSSRRLNSRRLYLGALDYDLDYVKKRDYYAIKGHPGRTTGKQFMAMMVCLVSGHEDLSDAKIGVILSKMGFITDDVKPVVDKGILEKICQVPEFKERIVHYLVHKEDRKTVISSLEVAHHIEEKYIEPLIDPNPAPRKKGGKIKSKSKRKPKSKKTRRKRSLVHHNLTR
jgi:hypothetical protein